MCSQGDPSSGGEQFADAVIIHLYPRVGGGLQAAAWARLPLRFRDPQNVIDVVHEAFAEFYLRVAHGKIRCLEGLEVSELAQVERQCCKYLYTLVKKYCSELTGGRRRQSLTELTAELQDQIPSGDGSPEEISERSEIRVIVGDALEQLDPISKEIIILQYFLQLSHNTIATVLETNVGTVKSRAYRARNKLGQILSTRLDLE